MESISLPGRNIRNARGPGRALERKPLYFAVAFLFLLHGLHGLGSRVSAPVPTAPEGAHVSAITALQFSGDASLLASGSFDGSVKIWSMEDRSLLKTFSTRNEFYRCAAVSPDGRLVAAGTEDNLIRIWSMRGEESIRALAGHTGAVNSLAFAPGGEWLASAGEDGTIKIWDVDKSEPRHSFTGHDGKPVQSLDISGDGKFILSAGEDGLIRVWALMTGFTLSQTIGPVPGVSWVAYSPDAKLIAAAALDDSGVPWVKVWHANSGLFLNALSGHTGRIHSIAFSPHGSFLAVASADSRISLWRVKPRERHVEIAMIKELAGHKGEVQSVVFSTEGRFLVSGGQDKAIRIWDLQTLSLARSIDWTGPVAAVAVLKGGLRILSASNDISLGSSLQIWNGMDGRRLQALDFPWSPIEALYFSRDGRSVMARGEDGRVRLWDLASGSLLRLFREGRTEADRPGGEVKGEELAAARSLEINPEQIRSLALSPDKSLLAVGDREGRICLWNVSDRSFACLLDRITPGFVLETAAAEVYRIDAAPIGELRLVASGRCGDSRDGKCVTGFSHLLLRFDAGEEVEALIVDIEEAIATSSRSELGASLNSSSQSHIISLKIRGGIDLAAGDEIRVTGIRISARPGIVGKGRYHDWRYESESKRWGLADFFLNLLIYPELRTSISVTAVALPRSSAGFEISSSDVARPGK